MLRPNNAHPLGELFELATAIRYAHAGFRVEFVPEGTERSADLRIIEPMLADDIQLECKRLRPSQYEQREAGLIRTLFLPLQGLVHARRLSVHVDVQFLSELVEVPAEYLAHRVSQAMDAPIAVHEGYPWRDRYAEGVVRRANLDAVRADMRDSSLLVGPKMARLLTGLTLSDEAFLLALRGEPRAEDPRYVDQIEYASALSWRCAAPESIEARARHVTSLLAGVDRQVVSADYAIAHIGMDAERDITAADLRRARNLEAVRSFRSEGSLAEVHLHYFLPRASEIASWTIDETVESNSVLPLRLLDDGRLFVLGESTESDVLAWHLPPPIPGRRI